MSLNKNTNFILLFSGKLVSQIGDSIFNIALSWYILELTGSALQMSVYLALGITSYIVAGSLMASFVDRYNKVKILYITDFIRGIVLLILFYSMLYHNNTQSIIIVFYISSVILNSCSALFNPSSLSVLPQLVEDEELVKANSLLIMINNFAGIVGLVFGVIIYEVAGMKIIAIVNAISYILSGVSEVFIKYTHKSALISKNSGILSSLNYIHKNTLLLVMILFAFTWNFIYIPIYSVYLPYCFNSVFNLEISYLGSVHLSLLIGFIVGSYISNYFKKSSNIYYFLLKVVALQLPLFISMSLFSYIGTEFELSGKVLAILFSCAFFFLGILISIVNVKMNVIIQTRSSKEFIGRVNSFKGVLANAAMPLGIILGGVSIKFLKISTSFLIQCFLFSLLVISMFIIRKNFKYEYMEEKVA